MRRRLRNSIICAALLPLLVGTAQAERVKDLASVQGVRNNQLVGYGLVVGLDGTGDQTSQAPFTIQSIKNMLVRFGVTIPPNTNPQLKNVAAVTVHADLPPFAKPGQNIDVTVSSIGNAGSLRGGSLIMTPLRGADGQVYAMAQGSLVVGGFGISGKDGSRIAVNVPSAGRVPNGATVEREVPTGFDATPYVILNLHTPDFTTSARLVEGINNLLGDATAQAMDGVSVKVAAPADANQRIAYLSTLEQIEIEPGDAPARVIVNSRTGTVVIGAHVRVMPAAVAHGSLSVRVAAPADPNQRIAYLSTLEQIEIEPGDAPARVIVNSRTGTVVIGSHVRVMPAAVAHGSLSVTITERAAVSQPNEFAQGDTVVVPQSTVNVHQPEARMFVFDAGVDLNDIVRAVNQVGAAPGDLVAILEALKESGALRAELIVI